MKLKKEFVLRQVANNWVVIPLQSDTVSFNGMLTLNESGALLWRELEAGADKDRLANALLLEYDVERRVAEQDVELFLESLVHVGCLVE